MAQTGDLKTFLYSWGVLAKSIIGIGIFSLPYAALKVGVPLGLVYLAVLGCIAAVVHLMFAELSLKTPDYKRMAGFAGIYLGKWAQQIAIVTAVIGFLGSLLAYIIIGGKFLHGFAAPVCGGAEIIYSLIYSAAGALLVYLGINFVAKFEFWGMAVFLVILAVLAVSGAPLVRLENLAAKTGTGADIFFPFGPMLFSFWASSSIPEIEEILGRAGKKKMMGKVIVASLLAAFAAYALFIILIAGISGAGTAESALIGLGESLGSGAAALLFFFGFITSFTSFVICGLALKKILAYDLKINKTAAWLITWLVPLGLFLAGFNDFMIVFSLIGGVFLAIDGILIVLMYQKIRPERKLAVRALLLIFIGGIIYELVHYLK